MGCLFSSEANENNNSNSGYYYYYKKKPRYQPPHIPTLPPYHLDNSFTEIKL